MRISPGGFFLPNFDSWARGRGSNIGAQFGAKKFFANSSN